MLFPYMSKHMIILFQYYFSLIGTPLDKLFMIDIAIVTVREFLLIVMPLAVAVAAAGVGSSFTIWIFIYNKSDYARF